MTKERLRTYNNIKREAELLRERIYELREAIASPRSPSLTGLPGGGQASDAMAAAVARLADLDEAYMRKLEALAAEQLEIERAIDTLESVERQLMRARYLDGLKWEEVCVVIGYSWQQTHRLHARALARLQNANFGDSRGFSAEEV